MKYLGVDPSERHTGLVILDKGHQPIFHEIYTGTKTVIEAAAQIREDLNHFWVVNLGLREEVCFAIEKQLPVGGQSSALLFYIYMAVLESTLPFRNTHQCHFVSPLPGQLKSYIKKMYRIETTSKTTIVNGWKAMFKYRERISSHRVEAWFLARLARDVLEGNWRYNLPSREAPLVPWVNLNGPIRSTNTVSRQKEARSEI